MGSVFSFFFSLEDQIRPVAQKLFRMHPKKMSTTVGRLKVLLVLCDPLSRLAGREEGGMVGF